MNTPSGAPRPNDAPAPPAPASARGAETPIAISHAEMNAALGRGHAVPLGPGILWLASYLGAWWVECEHGWLRVTDDLATADLDQAAVRLRAARAVAARDAADQGESPCPPHRC